MYPEFEPARLDDVEELSGLYRRLRGAVPADLSAPATTWLVARENGRIVASVAATLAATDRLAKLHDLVVDPGHRGGGIAHRAVATLAGYLLSTGAVDSVYGTTRTTTAAPQRIGLRTGFHALGLLPGARDETTALLARFGEDVLARRRPVHRVPAALGRLVNAIDKTVGLPAWPELVPEKDFRPAAERTELEFVDAPRFVQRTFDAAALAPVQRFYPLHTPNIVLAADFELYAQLSRADGHCALIGATPSPMAVGPYLEQVIEQLAGLGAHYVETLVPLHCFDELSVLLGHGFLPAALYPAMRRDGELFHDYVVLARTLRPLDFRGLAVDEAFRPFAEQYVDLWAGRYLNTQAAFH